MDSKVKENVGREVNLIPPGDTHPKARRVAARYLGAGSDQDEIDQRDQGRSDAPGDQDVVGAKVGLRVER
jgi:hypothetical protein